MAERLSCYVCDVFIYPNYDWYKTMKPKKNICQLCYLRCCTTKEPTKEKDEEKFKHVIFQSLTIFQDDCDEMMYENVMKRVLEAQDPILKATEETCLSVVKDILDEMDRMEIDEETLDRNANEDDVEIMARSIIEELVEIFDDTGTGTIPMVFKAVNNKI